MSVTQGNSTTGMPMEREAFLAVGELLPEPMLLIAGTGHIIAANTSAVSLYGYLTEDELVTKSIFELSREIKSKVSKFLDACARSRAMVFESMSFYTKSGKPVDCQAEGCAFRVSNSKYESTVLIRCVKEPTQKIGEDHNMIDNHPKDNVIFTFTEKYNRELEYLSYHDELTGLSNRRRFENRLISEWKRSVREQSTLALILVDVDYFKQYNDTYGHLAGDECLRRIAKTLQACCKRPADLSARYGGEEFILLLPDTNVEGATFLAETIREKIEDLNIRHETSEAHTIVTVSSGVAVVKPSQDDSQNELIAHADEALYFAKQHGRNLVALIPDPWLQLNSN